MLSELHSARIVVATTAAAATAAAGRLIAACLVCLSFFRLPVYAVVLEMHVSEMVRSTIINSDTRVALFNDEVYSPLRQYNTMQSNVKKQKRRKTRKKVI